MEESENSQNLSSRIQNKRESFVDNKKSPMLTAQPSCCCRSCARNDVHTRCPCTQRRPYTQRETITQSQQNPKNPPRQKKEPRSPKGNNGCVTHDSGSPVHILYYLYKLIMSSTLVFVCSLQTSSHCCDFTLAVAQSLKKPRTSKELAEKEAWATRRPPSARRPLRASWSASRSPRGELRGVWNLV